MPYRRRIALFILFSLLSFTFAGIVNRTIDDSFGDSQTLQLPLYLPPAGSWNDQTCQGCAIKPDPSSAFKKTYTAATYNPGLQNISISMGFEGTAIYVFFILANNQGDGITTLTMANFTIDGQIVGNFTHTPDLTSTAILFNQLAFSKTDLPNGIHQLVISTSGINTDVFVNFDYAIYTHVDGVDAASLSSSSTTSTSTSSSSATGPSSSSRDSQLNANSKSNSIPAIVGGVVGAVVGIGAIIGIFFCWKRRARNRQLNSSWEIAGPSNRNMNNAPESTTVTTPFLSSQFNIGDGNNNPREANNNTASSRKDPTSYPQFKPGRAPAHSTEQFSSSGPSFTASESIWSPSETQGTSTTSSREQVSRERQSEIKRRLYVVNQEMNELRQELNNHEPSGSSGFRNEKAPRGGDEDEMNRMREQVRAMQAQIEMLQSQQKSAWAQGLSNEAPPGYSP